MSRRQRRSNNNIGGSLILFGGLGILIFLIYMIGVKLPQIEKAFKNVEISSNVDSLLQLTIVSELGDKYELQLLAHETQRMHLAKGSYQVAAKMAEAFHHQTIQIDKGSTVYQLSISSQIVVEQDSVQTKLKIDFREKEKTIIK